MISAFLNGVLLGFSLVTPLGPQNSFILTRSNAQKTYSGTLHLVGTCAVCDGLLILLGVFGVQLLLPRFLIEYALVPGGAAFLFYFGWRTWKMADVSALTSSLVTISRRRELLFLIGVSVLNPHALIDTLMVIGGASAEYGGMDRRAFALGCLVSDVSWFVFLSVCGFYLNQWRWGGRVIRGINRVSALVMWAIAVKLSWLVFQDLKVLYKMFD